MRHEYAPSRIQSRGCKHVATAATDLIGEPARAQRARFLDGNVLAFQPPAAHIFCAVCVRLCALCVSSWRLHACVMSFIWLVVMGSLVTSRATERAVGRRLEAGVRALRHIPSCGVPDLNSAPNTRSPSSGPSLHAPVSSQVSHAVPLLRSSRS
jgi:hypothetical protein